MSQDGVEDIGDAVAETKFLKHEFQTSLAVDKDGANQAIEGDDWVEITATRVLWDLFENYDMDANDLKVDIAGVYFLTCNCESIKWSTSVALNWPYSKEKYLRTITGSSWTRNPTPLRPPNCK
ncbi:MAG: hypothetical protein HC841_03315 [Verrucomicrobiae bacterium]|nr:hypothetical protein [Verrucomicrobiae bacterium]